MKNFIENLKKGLRQALEYGKYLSVLLEVIEVILNKLENAQTTKNSGSTNVN